MKKSLLIFALLLVAVATSPALSQAKGNSFFDEGQIIVHLDPLFLLVDQGLHGGAEYYVKNDISAGLDVLSWSWGSGLFSASVTGFSPYARYHFKHAKTVFKTNKYLKNGNFYGYGGFSSITYTVFNVSNSYSGPFAGAGYFFVYDKNWVIDFAFGIALGTFSGWSPGGIGSGIGYAL